MNVDLELLIIARNIAVKLQQELRDSNERWRRKVNSLEEALETAEAERNALRRHRVII